MSFLGRLFGPPDVNGMFERADVPGLVKALNYEKDAGVREAAAAALGHLQARDAVESLVALLADTREVSAVRRMATHALGSIGDRRACKPLLAALEGENQDLEQEAALALGRIGEPAAVDPLLARLRDQRPAMRRTAAEALAQIGDPAAGAVTGMLKDPNPQVRAAVLDTLDRMGWDPGKGETAATYWMLKGEWDRCVALGSVAVRSLCQAMRNPTMAASAAEALGKIGDPDALTPLGQVLRGGYNQASDPRQRRAAAVALGAIGDPAAARPWLEAGLRDQDASVRLAVVQALGMVGGRTATEVLARAVTDSDEEIAVQAAAGLEKAGDGRAVKALIAGLDHEKLAVRARAAQALGAIGDPAAVMPLAMGLKVSDFGLLGLTYQKAQGDALKCFGAPAVKIITSALREPRDIVRARAAAALALLGEASHTERLLEVLRRDPSAEVRQGAALALGNLGGPGAVVGLLAALNDGSASVRRTVARALGKLGAPEAVEPLATWLTGENTELARVAAEVLGKIGDPCAVTHLKPVATNLDSEIRCEATEALGGCGGSEAVACLADLLHDGHLTVRRSAALALMEAADPQAIPALVKALDDWDSPTKQRALRALGKIGDPQVIDVLVGALADLGAGRAAALALADMGDPRAISALRQAARDRDSRVRKAAEAGLKEAAEKPRAPAPAGRDTCQFCNKQLGTGKGSVVQSMEVSDVGDLFSSMQGAADQMLARKVVCPLCGAAFCLECGNAIGHQRGTGKTHCPGCQEAVPSRLL